jgi:hypothetical protein
MSRQAAANASIPDPTVKVFFNIGSGRIGTLLFFVINLTLGKTVRTGSSGKVCADGKVSHETRQQRLAGSTAKASDEFVHGTTNNQPRR